MRCSSQKAVDASLVVDVVATVIASHSAVQPWPLSRIARCPLRVRTPPSRIVEQVFSIVYAHERGSIATAPYGPAVGIVAISERIIILLIFVDVSMSLRDSS